MIYADNAATIRMSEAAVEAMAECIRNGYGNASSLYTFGQETKERLEKAREEIAEIIGATVPTEILFTSGGSEADNQALISAAALGAREGKKHIVSTAFEHHAVLHTLKKLEKEGFEVALLEVHENGVLLPSDVEEAIRKDSVDDPDSGQCGDSPNEKDHPGRERSRFHPARRRSKPGPC